MVYKLTVRDPQWNDQENNVTNPQNGPLERLAANTAYGKKINKVQEIAQRPVAGDSQVMHERASLLAGRYKSAAELPKWKLLLRLPGLFRDTEKFFEDFPGEAPAA